MAIWRRTRNHHRTVPKNRAPRWSTSPPRNCTRCLDAQRVLRAARHWLRLHLGRRQPRRHQLPRHPGRVRSHRQTGRRPATTGPRWWGRAPRTTSPFKIGVGFKRPPLVPVGTSADLKGGSEGVCYRQPFGTDWTLSPLVSSPRSTARCREKRAARHRPPDPDRRRHQPPAIPVARCSIRLGG